MLVSQLSLMERSERRHLEADPSDELTPKVPEIPKGGYLEVSRALSAEYGQIFILDLLLKTEATVMV